MGNIGLHGFTGPPDGDQPIANSIDVNGALIGTTQSGGRVDCYQGYGCGTVFRITRSGETVLYGFKNVPDGALPLGSPVDLNGALYGTTYRGATGTNCANDGCGTVYRLTPAGESVLYSFKGGSDGLGPIAGLVNVKGTLYGTTQQGGAGNCSAFNYSGCGTVFKITSAGNETVLHSFKGGSDGIGPSGSLIDVNGTLYGTTVGGGSGIGCGNFGCGTVFAISPRGAEHVLYSFQGLADGWSPSTSLLEVKGALYGTTPNGGSGCSGWPGCGTVFKVTKSGTESVLYSFTGSSDGSHPASSLIDVDGTLYGTTYQTSEYNCCGTVFGIAL
jgi:uncharacterized repeat protein (TIGR03803 family)